MNRPAQTAAAYHYDFSRSGIISARRSASIIVPVLIEQFHPVSVVDVGCGLGDWLAEFRRYGCKKTIGYDGKWVQQENLQIDANDFRNAELHDGVEIQERFDMALCVEVAEHISEDAGQKLVRSLTSCSSIVIFGAAVPEQGGYMHINEQYQSYWIKMFQDNGFFAYDLIRPRVWLDDRVCWWYQQNTIVYATEMAAKRCGLVKIPFITDVIHPFLYNRARNPATWGGREMIKALAGKFKRQIFAEHELNPPETGMPICSSRLRDAVAVDAVVLIPAYNASSTIAETLEALQNNSELKCVKSVIILDDASRDATVAAAKSAWRSTVPLEVWSNLSNAGERTTTNVGFKRLPADIEWAFILHADDVVKTNWISLYWNEMIGCADDVATICSSYDSWNPESGQIHAGEEFPDKPSVLVKGTRAAVLDTLNRGCWWHISGCAIRIRAFHQIGEFEATLPQTGDWEWLLRCLDKGFSVLYLPRSTMRYRQHEHSVSSISFRRGRDIREQLRMLTSYRERGYLSSVEYRRKVRGLMYQVARRTLIRAVRRDLTGALHHARLFAETAAKYR